MNIIAGFSSENSIEAAVNDLKIQFKECNSKMIIYFASSVYAPDKLSLAMQNQFPDAEVFGCTSAGELVSGKMLRNTIAAMSLDAEIIDDIKVEVVTGISGKPDLNGVFSSFEKHFGVTSDEMDIDKYVGIILIDCLQNAEERIMDEIGDLSNILFVGGSAGDDLKFKKNYVFSNGKAYADSALLALLKPRSGFDVIKTQSFSLLDKTLCVTKADREKREVMEFDNKPAAKAYADTLNASVEDIERLFIEHPLGLIADGDPYVRCPIQVLPENRIRFACNISEGMELTVLQATDIVADTKNIMDEKEKQHKKIKGIIQFNCAHRTWELEAKGLTDAYSRIFSYIPTVGFSTYGEQYLGHMNQTATMILFL